MPGSFTCLYYHLVFATKDRVPLITPDLKPRLWAYVGGIVRAEKGVALAVGGTDNHVHMLTKLDKQSTVADVMRVVKGNASRWVHETFPHLSHFAWQDGYGAFTVSIGGLDQVTRYIQGQEEHHRDETFEQEFETFLKRHGIKSDRRHLWG